MKTIRIIDEETIEIKEYRTPKSVFPHSVDFITSGDFEEYCIFSAIIRPFEMYYENERLKNKENNI